MRILALVTVSFCFAFLFSCSSPTSSERAGEAAMAAPAPTVVAAATERQRAALIDRVKALEGEWVLEDAPATVASRFDVSSMGSIVRETMFPGADHEMTNVYHMDGASLVMTHYCGGGNQPRMRAGLGDATTAAIALRPDVVTNLRSEDEVVMGSMTLHFLDDDRIRQEWQGYRDGRAVADHLTVFELRRRR